MCCHLSRGLISSKVSLGSTAQRRTWPARAWASAFELWIASSACVAEVVGSRLSADTAGLASEVLLPSLMFAVLKIDGRAVES